MKQIVLQSLPAPEAPDDESQRIDFADMIRNVIRLPMDRAKGASFDEVVAGVRILDCLKGITVSTGQILRLEDADYDHLILKIEHMSWGLIDERVVKFVHAIRHATPADSGPVPAPDSPAEVTP